MYFKLALKNAKRSLFDYLLYITTTVLLLIIMFISNYVALIAHVIASFQSVSLPLLISFILLILISYINKFMLKQRSKEFANYILLGMEKKNLVNMFLCEFCLIGVFCFIISILLGFIICFFLSFTSCVLIISLCFKAIGYSFLYFFVIELFSMYCIRRRIYILEISELMIEKKRNLPIGVRKKYQMWKFAFFVNIGILLLILCSILLLPDDKTMAILSIVFLPLIFAVFSFYKWMFQWISHVRQKQSNNLFKNERLYMIAKMTSGVNTTLQSIFCLCLIISSMSFIFGTFMLQTNYFLFNQNIQLWMGFLQICLCIIFIVIYFSILSLQQIIDNQLQIREFRILHSLGKSKKQLNRILIKQILANLCFPTCMCFVILGISLPFLNYKLNDILPIELSNFCIKTARTFSLCFMLLYLLYFIIVYIASKHIVEISTKR